MINFESTRFQTLQSLYSLLFIFIVKMKDLNFYSRLNSLFRVSSKFTLKIEKWKLDLKFSMQIS